MLPSPRRLPLALSLLVATAALFSALTAASAPPATSAAPATSASAKPAAPVPESELPLLRGSDIPAEPSEAPKAKAFGDEWMTSSKRVRPSRLSGGPCEFAVVREWLRIRCNDRMGASLFAGDPTDVRTWAVEDSTSGRMVSQTTIITRLKRGDSKLFSLIELESGYESDAMGEGEKIAVTWREGREDPVILISRH